MAPKTNKALDAVITKALRVLKPPEDLTVSEWADKHRRLSPESSAEAGPWRTSRTPYLKEFMDAFSDPAVRHIVMVAGSQVGKALAINTPIPTPDGWKTMGELQVGDRVFSDDGKPCTVTAVTEVMYDHPCYRLTFSDGSEIIADKDHKWAAYEDSGHGAKRSKYRVLTTGEMVDNQHFSNNDGKQRNRYSIPVASALDLPERELPFPPYTLGVWLGDGNSHSAEVTTAAYDAEILDYIRAEGITVETHESKPGMFVSILNPQVKPHDRIFCIRGHDMRVLGRTKAGYCAECARQQSKHDQYGFAMDKVIAKQQTGHSTLNQMGVLKNKHIPPTYLRASKDQRLALLQGLMDTDGTINQNGMCEFVQKSKRLTDDMSELLHSLGIKHTIKVKKATCAYNGNRYECDVYRIQFLCYAETPVFKLKRKFAKQPSINSLGRHGKPRRTTETLRRRITAIEPVESVPVKCIAVDSPNHLYLAGRSMIPTHNSESINNIIGYIIDQDPGSILFIQPQNGDAKEYSKLRIAPMIRDTPTLRRRVSSPKSRDSGNTILQKAYPGGILTLTGASEAHALASKPIRYVLGDERDRWTTNAGNEGDPWKLAMARQITFYNAKSVEVSTPTIKGASAIVDAFYKGTQERWCVACPACGQYHNIVFKDIRYSYDVVEVNKKKTFLVKEVYWVCPECGVIAYEAEMKRQPAKWIAESPDALKNGTRSFWLNSFVSPWLTWDKIILDYLEAIGNPRQLQVVYNTLFGELWEDRGGLEDEDSYMGRREQYDAELPDGVLVLTCGVDTQDDRLEYEVVGYGLHNETWGVQRGQIMGRPDDPAVWERLDDVVDHVYRYKDGKGLKVSMTLVDEGGHFTQDVRYNCQRRINRRMFACKGFFGADKPYTSPPKKMRIVIRGQYVGTCWQYQIGVDAGKQNIMDNLRVQTPGSRYCHFPLNEECGYGHAFFMGLLSEHLVYKENSRHPWQWEKIPGHERNEPLDCRNYANAAFKTLNADMDALYRRRLTHTAAEQTPARKPPAPRRSAQRKGFDIDKYFD